MIDYRAPARRPGARQWVLSAALNLNVHALVLDGVLTRDADGRLRFHPEPTIAAPWMNPVTRAFKA